MLSRNAKALFYVAAAPAMALNGVIYRTLFAPSNGGLKAHLGPGRRNYLKGWINIDANAFTGKCDIWADLRNPLPLRSGTVKAAYSHHVIEHLPDRAAHLRDVFRILESRGVYRVAVPNGDTAVRKLMAGDRAWFGSWPDDRRSIGGRFENFIFCRGEHVTIFFQDFMTELLTDAGFTDIRKVGAAAETHYPELFADVLSKEEESDPAHPMTLVLEAVKP